MREDDYSKILALTSHFDQLRPRTRRRVFSPHIYFSLLIYAVTAMKRMAVSNVLIVGLQGLGVEIGDNVSRMLPEPGSMPCFQPKMLLLLASSPLQSMIQNSLLCKI